MKRDLTADIERAAKAMFEEDEADRYAMTRIARMTWDQVGKVYQDRWRSRAKVAIDTYRRRGK